MSQNPYLFIVGCGRSGTTLLQRIVDAHPRLAVINETRWVPRVFKGRRGLTPDGFVTPELVPRLLQRSRFSQLGIGRADLEGLIAAGEPVSYSRFVTGIFDLYANTHGKPLAGD